MASVVGTLWSRLRDTLIENAGLKALSLAFALGLFAYLHGQQDQQMRTIPVAVVVRPPEDVKRELMTTIPPSIHVTLRGSTRAIDRVIQSGNVTVEIDLRDGHTESIVFEPKMFSLPSEVEIAIIDPPSIELEWQDVVTRQIPVQASITGQPAEGFVVKGELQVEPGEITASGPARLVEVLQFARLAPFDVTGLTEGAYRRPIAIDAPPARVSYIGPQSATVTVTIARRLSEARFAKRPVEVVGVANAVITPRAVDVTVLGPPEVVRALRAEQVVPRADIGTVPGVDLKSHGAASVKVTVDLARAEAEVQPPSVNVRW